MKKYRVSYHLCEKDCSLGKEHVTSTTDESDSATWFFEESKKFTVEEGHPVIYSSLLSQLFGHKECDFLCLACDLFIPLKYLLKETFSRKGVI